MPTRAYTLYKKYTQEQLVALDVKICTDPASRVGASGIWIYNEKTRKMLDDISRAISYHQQDKRDKEKAA